MQMHMLLENVQSVQKKTLSYPYSCPIPSSVDDSNFVPNPLVKIFQIESRQPIPNLIQRTPDLRLHPMTATTLVRKPHLRTIARQIKLIHIHDQILKRNFQIRRFWGRPYS